ncbi:MAG: thiamine pyrophosphate-dependent dehydrogenase E1 component subunit alpha [Pseudomonadota bacterium]
MSGTVKDGKLGPGKGDLHSRLLWSMLRIRRVQERIESLYLEDRMKTPVHLCVGQEAIAVGACEALEPADYISSNHRGHGHYLAKGGSLKGLIAELHCRKTGCSRGYGGSMHLVDTRVGHLGSSSIVGGGIPLGTGMGLASKLRGTERVSVVFFGDGAADEGVLYESVNAAMLWKLPVVYILENNQWSVCSRVSARQAGRNVFHRSDPGLMFTADIDGNDVAVIYETACKAVERARKGLGPSFIECRTYRIPGHAGCRAQDPDGYREQKEIEAWQKRCPVETFKNRLIAKGLISENDITLLEDRIEAEIDEAFSYALNSPLPGPEDLEGWLYCE